MLNIVLIKSSCRLTCGLCGYPSPEYYSQANKKGSNFNSNTFVKLMIKIIICIGIIIEKKKIENTKRKLIGKLRSYLNTCQHDQK